MGTMEIVLCIFVGHFIAVQSVIKEQDVTFSQEFPGFLESIIPFPFKSRHFDFTPYDTIFSSWQTRTPDSHMLAEFPPITNVPTVEVFCDDSTLTLLVDKRSNGVMLTGEEMQLGDDCYSNRQLPNRFVFTYSLKECGTARVMQNGLEMFTNSLHLNLKELGPARWQTPSTMHISCIPKRSYDNPNFVSMAIPENGKTLNIKAMNPSWTSTAESNIYKRGQAVNLQVSAKTRPEQQLFIQSCFASASPNPQTRSRHTFIMNKGCTAPLGSSHAVVQFVASNRADVVSFVLNTSYLISELYIHCSVLISDQGVTFGSKSCNYNAILSRWEDLSATVEVCDCCSSKCKGLSVKHLPEDAKAIVSTGPLIIVDKDVKMSPEPYVSKPQTSSAPVTNSMQSDAAATEDMMVSGPDLSRSKFSSPPRGVVFVSQDPVARLTLWLPGQVEDNEHGELEDNLTVQLQSSDTGSDELPELHPSATDQESLLNTPTNKMGAQSANELGSEARVWDLNFLKLADFMTDLDKAAIAEESQRKMWFGRSGLSDTEAPQEANIPLPGEMTLNVLNQNHFNQMRDKLAPRQAAVMPQEETTDARPIIRSKLQLSKSTDGSQTLSYEEEVVKQQEGDCLIRRCGMNKIKRKQKPRQRGLIPIFLDLLRRMDKAE